MRKHQGFTLIELLVVIAIIAILAAILFPVFARARAKARQTSCLSNMKQCVLAMLMYTNDNDGYMPGRTQTPTGYLYYPQQCAPYLAADEIRYCSAVKGGWGNQPHFPAINMAWEYFGSGARYTIEAFDYPTKTVVLWEGWSCNGNNPYVQYWMMADPYRGGRPSAAEGCGTLEKEAPSWNLPHNEGTNAGFPDGHAKWIPKGKVDTVAEWWDHLNPAGPGLR